MVQHPNLLCYGNTDKEFLEGNSIKLFPSFSKHFCSYRTKTSVRSLEIGKEGDYCSIPWMRGTQNHFLRVCFYASPSDPSLTEQQGTFSSANEVTLLRAVLAIMKNNISGRTQCKIIVFRVPINSLVHKLGISVNFPITWKYGHLKRLRGCWPRQWNGAFHSHGLQITS